MKDQLRKIILENEGDRDDIYSDVLAFVKSMVDALEDIKVWDDDLHDTWDDPGERAKFALDVVNEVKQ